MTIDRRQAEGLVVDEMRQSMTLSRIAQTIEISESGMSRKVSGRSPFTESERVKLCRLFGVSLKDWNAKIADKMAQYEGAVPPEPPPDAPRVAAGSPSAAAAYNERHGYQTERRGDGAEKVVVYGDSMEPLLHTGDSLWCVPIKPSSPAPYGQVVVVYVWNDDVEGGGPVIGVLHPGPSPETLTIVKSNQRHAPVYAPREHVRAMSIVVESCRRV